MNGRSISWKIVVPSLAFAALLIAAEYFWLRQRQQTQRTVRANELVEAKIATARGYLGEQRWHEAIRELEDALDVENATNGGVIYPLLETARRSQAEALFDGADFALTHRRLEDARRLLRAYLTHPQAGRLDRARILRDDLERALSDEEAAQLLARLSDEELRVFTEKRQLAIDDGLHLEVTRSLFQETLGRNVAKEMRRREAQQEVKRLTAQRRAAEHAQRIARLRATPTFRSLTAFMEQTLEQLRIQQQLASRQEAELQVLFQQLGVTDETEKQQIRTDLHDHETTANVRDKIERKRSEVKRIYRNQPQLNAADGELFDQLVDQAVDKFLTRLPPSSANPSRARSAAE